MVAVTPTRCTTLVALVALLLPAPLARADWAPARPLGSVPGRIVQQVLVGADGRARVLWTSAFERATLWEDTTAAHASARRLAVLGRADVFPVAQTTSTGRAVVVFERHEGYSTAQVVARVQRHDGRFSLPIALSPSHQTARAPVLAMNGAGDALAAWRLRDGTVEVAMRPRGRLRFARADRVAAGRDPRADFDGVAVSVGPRGAAALVFAADGREHLATGSVRAGLGRPRSIGPATLPAPAAVATGPAGPLAAWTGDGACRAFPGGLAAMIAGAVGPPAVAIGGSGMRTVACRSDMGLQVFSAAPGAAFGVEPELVGSAPSLEAPSLAVAADGGAVLAWLEQTPGGLAPAVAERPAGAGTVFGPPRLLDAPHPRTLGPLVALGAGGRAVAAWADGHTRAAERPFP